MKPQGSRPKPLQTSNKKQPDAARQAGFLPRSSTVGRVMNFQGLAGNSAVARIVAARESLIPNRGPGLALRGNSVGQQAAIQRHTQGVLDNIAADLAKRRTGMRDTDPSDPTGGDLLAYINKNVSDISALPGMVTICDTPASLIDALAVDLAARAGASSVDQAHRQAATNDVNNGGGGFTALDGTVYMLESANDSSALYHELIHVLSAEGGVTQLSKTKMNLNEGFTNYFAEQLSEKYKKRTFPAYPVATQWVRQFATKYGDATAYNLYFKDNEALLYSTLAKTVHENATADLKVHEANAKGGPKAPTRWTSGGLNAFKAGKAIKDESALATLIKTKIASSQFLETTEPNLVWLENAIFKT